MAAPQVRTTVQNQTFTAATQVVISKPVGVADGDILVVFIMFAEATGDITVYPDANWSTAYRTTGGGQAQVCGYKLIAASEGSTWTFQFGGSRNGIAHLVVIDGDTTNNELTGTPAGQQNATGSSQTTPSLTTGVNDALVLTSFGGDTNATRSWSGGGDVELADGEEGTLFVTLAVYSSEQATAGAVSKTATVTGGNLPTDTGIIAFAPNAGGGTTTLTADHGSFSANGQAALFQTSVSVEHGSFS